MAEADPRGDGPRRAVRPAGRRIRAVQRRRGLGGAALREDALRQRPAAGRLHPRVAAVGLAAGGPRRRGDGRLAGAGDADRRGRLRREPGRRLRSTRPGTRTRAPSTCWTPAELRAVLGEDDGAWAAEVLGVTAAGTFERGASTLQRPAELDPERWGRVQPLLLAARERAGPTGPRRQGGDGLERLAGRRAGAGGRGLRPARLAGARADRGRPALAAPPAGRPAACGPPGTGAPARPPASSRTTRRSRWPRPGWPRPPGDPDWLDRARQVLQVVLDALRRRRRRLLRHRRRRRAAVHPPPGPDRQRDAVRAQLHGARAAPVRRADGGGPLGGAGRPGGGLGRRRW